MGPVQKDLVLILARDLAANVAVPLFVTDPTGRLVFYNEAAEEVLGKRFADAGEIPAEEWGRDWSPRTLDDTPLRLRELPLAIALRDRRPSHMTMRITGSDEVVRDIEVTALPLFAHADDLVGAVALFWSI